MNLRKGEISVYTICDILGTKSWVEVFLPAGAPVTDLCSLEKNLSKYEFIDLKISQVIQKVLRHLLNLSDELVVWKK